jgi:hypothetical protein
MSSITTVIIALFLAVSNFTLLLQIFPCKFGLRVSIGLLVFLAVLHFVIIFAIGPESFTLGGFRGLLYFPLFIVILRGGLLQKLFVFSFQIVFTVSTALLAGEVAGFFFNEEGFWYNIFRLAMIILIYTAYVVLVTKHITVIYEKLFAPGCTKDWAIYSFTGMTAFVMMMATRMTITSGPVSIAIIFFVLLTFALLIIAIINTHEKTKQKIDSRFTQSILSSGREHYHKMNELYKKLYLMRRDFRQYLNTARGIIHSGNAEEADWYLTTIEQQMAGIEKPVYCRNVFINNLIAGYEDRCKELRIQCTIRIAIPEFITVPDYDLCIILGSLLENAVEACMKLEEHRFIELETHIKASRLLVMVKNSFNGIVMTDETGSLITTKTNGGIGLRGVKEVVSRHSGDLLTEWIGDTFTAYAAVQI